METRRRLGSLSAFSYFLLLLLLTFSPLLGQASAAASLSSLRISDSGGSGEQKVSLVLYYETLCPYCSNFIVNELANIFENGLISIVDLNLVPYGNARIEPNNTISCQHGPSECLLNTVEACAIDAWPKLSEHFPLIYCIESLVYEHKYAEWESCFEELGLDAKPIGDCYTGGHGKELELAYAAETNNLDPPHQYVPWVVVNGKPLYEDYENFVSYICEAYNGTSVPEACSEPSLNRVSLKEVNQKHRVCYLRERLLSMIIRQVKSYANSAIQSMYDGGFEA